MPSWHFFVKKVFFLSFLGNCAFKLYLLCIPSEILRPRLRKVSKSRNLESSCYTLTNFAVFLKYTLAGSQLASRLCYCSLSGRVSVPKVFLRRQLFIASNPINLWNVSSFGLCHRVTLFKVLVSSVQLTRHFDFIDIYCSRSRLHYVWGGICSPCGVSQWP